jgi:diguanylate cyclase (GGDEF)-like protein/PAS domain S-box-containing protein
MGMPLRALIIEDSEDDAALMVHELRRGGYEPVYERVETPKEMTAALDRQPWDVILADYAMPHFSGTDALRVLKEKGLDLPFIIVSGTIGEEAAVAAMKTGAHDYIMKGNLKRLVPAIERELREAEVRRGHKRAEESLRQSEEYFQSLIENSSDIITVIDVEGRILYDSPSVERILGYRQGELIGKRIFQFVHPDEISSLTQIINKASQGLGKIFSVEYRFRDRDGSWRVLESVGRGYRNLSGAIVGIINSRDITERKQAEEMVQRMAFHSTLTDLPNRNMLYDRLLNAVRINAAESKPFALILMDLDRFKEVNDTLGHQRGDFLLQQVGLRLKSVLFEPDTVAHLGGDEFAILLPKLAAAEHINVVIQKIQKALEEPFTIEGLPIAVEASMGIALYPDHGANPESLMQRADVAMHAAKQTGSGIILYDAKHDQHSPRRLALMGELRRAIEQDQLFLQYQPKISLRSGRTIGAEALVRWKHPQHGLIPPDQFILPAERTGLIHPLTQWVLKTALQQCQAWHQTGLEVPISVNISARNLLDSQLPEQLKKLLQVWKVASDWLTFEITESAIMADPARAMEILLLLSRIGIGLSIDDFGTGYSSLGYLKRLPVQEIKIDKSFVMDMLANEDDTVIVISIINLAHNLGLKVVAEGVENQETKDRLSAFGCDSAQGYLMSRPLPAGELARWMSESAFGSQGEGRPS